MIGRFYPRKAKDFERAREPEILSKLTEADRWLVDQRFKTEGASRGEINKTRSYYRNVDS